MTFLGYVAALLPTFACWLALRALDVLHGWARVAAAFAIALGVSSATFFVALTAGLPIRAYLLAEALGALLIAGYGVGTARRGSTRLPPVGCRPVTNPALRLLAFAAIGLAGLGVAADVRYELGAHPFGHNDTWAIWNVRAAFLAAGQPAWVDGFTAGVPLPHQDYPLLLPGAVARLWSLVGGGAGPAGYLSVSVLVACALLVGSEAWRRIGVPAMIASVGLLLTPELVRQGGTQHADLLVGLYAVLGVVLLSARPLRTPHIIFAGLACGCAAWTKNEGVLIALFIPTVAIAMTWKREGRSAAAGAAADLAIGLGPFIVLLVLFKLWLAPENDVVSGAMASGFYIRWTDSFRIRFVLREMGLGLWTWGDWPLVPPLLAAAIVSLVPKPDADAGIATSGSLALSLVVLMLMSFFVVYVMTPHSVAWHIGTSWSRLITQMWPSVAWMAVALRARLAPDR